MSKISLWNSIWAYIRFAVSSRKQSISFGQILQVKIFQIRTGFLVLERKNHTTKNLCKSFCFFCISPINTVYQKLLVNINRIASLLWWFSGRISAYSFSIQKTSTIIVISMNLCAVIFHLLFHSKSVWARKFDHSLWTAHTYFLNGQSSNAVL